MLVLVLYSEQPYAAEMREIQRSYLSRAGVPYLFYTYRDQEEEFAQEGDMLYIRGEETLLGILDKTVKALEYTREWEYDYVLRTNISTLVNLKKVRKAAYAGERIQLYETDLPCGITPAILEEYRSLRYARGIAILLQRSVVHDMLADKSALRHDIIDDMAIGIWCRDRGIPLLNWAPYTIVNPPTFVSGSIFVYRNKHKDRFQDVQMMRRITRNL